PDGIRPRRAAGGAALDPPRLLPAGESPRGDQQPEEAGEDREDPARSPRGEPADGLEAVRRSVEQAGRLVPAEGECQAAAVGERGGRRSVAEGVRDRDREEENRERRPARAHVAERALRRRPPPPAPPP